MTLTDKDTAAIQSVLSYWFGDDKSTWDKSYAPRPKLWFLSDQATDDAIAEQFGDLLKQLQAPREDGDVVARWRASKDGRLALILLCDQLTRNAFRGTADMFSLDPLALELTKEMLDDAKTLYSPPELLFYYMPLMHAEDVECSKLSLQLFKELPKLVTDQDFAFAGFLGQSAQLAQQHADILNEFGRFPHRSAILGRPLTPEEAVYLSARSNEFAKSVEKRTGGDKPKQPRVSQADKDKDQPRMRTLRVLVLHGYRQNGNSIRKATQQLARKLPHHAKFVYVNAPMPYRPDSKDLSVPHSHQRAWWNFNPDGQTYDGLDVTLPYLEHIFASQGPFDGLLGFSQGASLIGLMGVMKERFPHSFAVCISGFPLSDPVHKPLMTKAAVKGVASLHIYGKLDKHLGPPDVMEAYTRALAEIYDPATAEVVEHSGGHFTPQHWPHERMAEFVRSFAQVDDTPQQVEQLIRQPLSGASFEDKLKLTGTWHSRVKAYVRPPRQTSSKLDKPLAMTPLGLDASAVAFLEQTDALRGLLAVPASVDVSRVDGLFDSLKDVCSIDDMVTIAFALIAGTASENGDDNIPHAWLLRLMAADPSLVKRIMPLVPVHAHWRDLVKLAVLNRVSNISGNYADAVHQCIVDLFVQQLRADLKTLKDDSMAPQAEDPTIVSDDEDDEPAVFSSSSVSQCAFAAPRPRSSADHKSSLGKDIAALLFPVNEEPVRKALATPEAADKRIMYLRHHSLEAYRRVVVMLCRKYQSLSADANDLAIFEKQRKDAASVMTEEQRQAHLNGPPSQFVAHPEPEPVVPCTLDQLDGLLQFMSINKSVPESIGGQLQFDKGTIIEGKRLDLCKQVVGPQGIAPLLDTMKQCESISTLMIGNNIVGNDGARRIADYIRDPDSKILTWYIAGNDFDADGIKHVTDALETDTKVEALWLKRNPLMPEGAAHVARMLRVNTHLHTLDLLNTGIGDEGACMVLDAVQANTNSGLRHLCLDTNHLTVKTAERIRDFFATGSSRLESLTLSCNRLGDKGVQLISEGLKHDKHLVRLVLSSNCVGAAGLKHLVDAIKHHPTLQMLGLGYMRGTVTLGSLGNFIGDQGATYIAEHLLPNNAVIRSLDLTHNSISPAGIAAIANVLTAGRNMSLTNVELTQFGQLAPLPLLLDDITRALERNAQQWGRAVLARNGGNLTEDACLAEGQRLTQDVYSPPHIRNILSVYRTK
ncbi:hypothetical protein RI367_008005 [Sorochytrium milnesiophthora]